MAQVAEVEDGGSHRYIMKRLRYHFKTRRYRDLLGEVRALRLVGGRCLESVSVSGPSVVFPRLIACFDEPHQLTFIIEKMSGEPLNHLPLSVQPIVLSNVITALRRLTSLLNKQERRQFSSISSVQILVAFPYYLLRAVVKRISKNVDWVSVSHTFFSYGRSFFGRSHVLTHHDLNPNNILVSQKAIAVIDLEKLGLSIPEMDLVRAMPYYYKTWEKKTVLDWLEDKLPKRSDRRSFSALTAYVGTQNAAISAIEADILASLDYIDFFLQNIVSRLINHKEAV